MPLADSQHIAAALPNAALVTFPGDLHDVLNEHDRDTVHNTIAAFLLNATAAHHNRASRWPSHRLPPCQLC